MSFFSSNLGTRPVRSPSRLKFPLAFLPFILLSHLVRHTPVSDCPANFASYDITIGFHHFQNVIVGEFKKIK